MSRVRTVALYLLPLALLAVLGWKAFWSPFLSWPFPQASFDPELIRRPKQVAVALAFLFAPMPLALAASLGLRKARGGADDPVGTLMAQLAVLAGVDLAVFFGLVATGLATKRLALAALAGVGLAGLAALRWAWAGAPGSRERARGAAGTYVLMASALAGCGLAAVHFGQEVGWDLFNYHVYNAHAFLHGREGLDFAVADRETHLNPLLDVALYLLVGCVRPVWVGFTVGAVHGAGVVLLYAVAREVLGRTGALRRVRGPLAAACALAGACEPMFLSQLGTSFHDNVIAVLVLAALVLVVRAVATGAGWGWVAAAGALAGAATGFKLTGATYAVGMSAALLLAPGGWRRRLALPAAFAAGSAAGFVLTNGYWMAHLYAEYGSPFFPLFNSVFKSPYWAAQDLDFLHLTADFGWKDHLLVPYYLAENTKLLSEAPSRDVRPAVAYTLLLLVGLGRLVDLLRADWRSPARLREALRGPLGAEAGVVVGFAVASYLVWYRQFRILRYLVAVKVLLPLVCVLLLLDLFRSRRRVWAAAWVLLVFTSARVDVASFGRREWNRDYVAADVPRPIEPAANGMVLMTWVGGGGADRAAPFGALVTTLPQSMRYIKLDSPQVMNPFGPEPLAMQEEVRRVILAHEGPFFLLTHRGPAGMAWASKLLDRYGLEVPAGQTPQTIDTWCRELGYWRVERRGAVAAAAKPGAGAAR